jgi:hypothetical protein
MLQSTVLFFWIATISSNNLNPSYASSPQDKLKDPLVVLSNSNEDPLKRRSWGEDPLVVLSNNLNPSYASSPQDKLKEPPVDRSSNEE